MPYVECGMEQPSHAADDEGESVNATHHSNDGYVCLVGRDVSRTIRHSDVTRYPPAAEALIHKALATAEKTTQPQRTDEFELPNGHSYYVETTHSSQVLWGVPNVFSAGGKTYRRVGTQINSAWQTPHAVYGVSAEDGPT